MKTFIKLSLFIFLILLSGCKINGVNKSDLKDTLKDELSKKYNIEIELSELTKEDANMGLSPNVYSSEIIDINSNKTFYARIYENSNKVEDTYAKVLYDNEIQRRLNKVINKHPNITIINYNYKYFPSSDTWNNIEDYLKYSTSMAMIDIKISEDSIENMATILTDFFENLNNYNFQYTIECNINDTNTIIFGNVSDNQNTYNYVLNKLKLEEGLEK